MDKNKTNPMVIDFPLLRILAIKQNYNSSDYHFNFYRMNDRWESEKILSWDEVLGIGNYNPSTEKTDKTVRMIIDYFIDFEKPRCKNCGCKL